MRAVAVLAVVLYHASVPFLPGGFVGVDVFFVISGFLITSHLLSQLRSTGRIAFGSFYARRARRLLPAAFVVLAVTAIATVLWINPLWSTDRLKDAVATALYVPNYWFAAANTGYLAENTVPSPFQHYWSLGAEEQFYLFWPALLLGLWLLARRRRTWMAIGMVAVAVASLVFCIAITTTNQPWAFFSLPSRAWEFAAGGVVAFLLARRSTLPVRLAVPASWIGLAMVLAAIFLYSGRTVFPGVAAVLPVLGTALLIWGGATASTWSAGRVLSVAPLVFIGEISYSLYLVHWPLLIVPQTAIGLGRTLPFWASLGLAAAAIPLAWVLYRYVETPFREGGVIRRLRPSVTLLTAAGLSAVLVIGCLGGGYLVSHRQLGSGEAAATPLTAANAAGTVPANLSPALRTAMNTRPPADGDGCLLEVDDSTTPPATCLTGSASAPLVVLFGDSHATQWEPALQPLVDAGKIRLDIETKSGCPFADVPVHYFGQPYPGCTDWRPAALTRIEAAHPALILVSSFQVYAQSAVSDQWAAADVSLGQLEAGMRRTLSTLAAVAPVAYIADSPLPQDYVPGCLSVHLTDAAKCQAVLDPRFRNVEKTVAAAAQVTYLDFDAPLCTRDTCPSVIGDTLVYRDNSHLSTAAVAALGPAVRSRITELPALGGS